MKLETAYLPPSRMILKEKLDVRLGYFKNIGIENVKQLMALLKKKEKFIELSKVNNLSSEYLTILLREINSMLPKPNKVSEFPNLSPNVIAALEKVGIKNTQKLYDRVLTKKARIELAEATGLTQSEVLELTKLTDLSRIKWVGVNFARMLYDLGIDTVEKATRANPVELHEMINQINKEREIYKGQIGLNDIKIFVDAATEIPLDIEY